MAQDKNGSLSVDDSTPMPTYSAAGTITPAATATDILTIAGSATKRVRIRKISINGTQTTAGVVAFYCIKRSTLNSGGTSATPTKVPHDSTDPAATATVTSYSANPTGLGTTVGNVTVEMTTIEAPASGAMNDHFDPTRDLDAAKDFTLNNVNENLAINLNGVTITGGALAYTVVWSEEQF